MDSTAGFGALESWCTGLLWKGKRCIYPDKRRNLRSNQDYSDISGASEALPRVFTSASASYWSGQGAWIV
jgi:hypothetical protein